MTDIKIVAVASVQPDLDLHRTGKADDGFDLLAIDAFLEQMKGPHRETAAAAARVLMQEAVRKYGVASSELTVRFVLSKLGTDKIRLDLSFAPKGVT